MKSRIEGAYPHGSTCIVHHTRTVRRVFDCPIRKRALYRTGKRDPDLDFEIKNPTGRDFYTISVDGCLYPTSKSPKRCDYAVFWNDTIVFIEFKLGMPVGRTTKVPVRMRQALDQLIPTIRRFERHGIFVANTKIEAVAFVSRHLPRPLNSISMQAAKDRLKTAFPTLNIRFKVTKSRSI
ncbi:hypothetical protein CLV45_2885 [Hymenobacter chitinivorans DSM 11115]|uniref:Uncharacterized protein n=1 Tax=Hymenobacter chitinivorans DSM 11115 TaxID=1121954 RepID=A0A2M9B9C6_9BACT|nr:hypothetical protein CLV45_2885 [Hymenobacter chitinivorans DSM 11115]